jgi:Fe-Mn family superoxide dismutase
MAFELPDLPYAHDALEALGMSRETMEYHHDIHHKAYVDNGNKLVAGTEWEGKTLEDIVAGTYAAGAVAQSGLFNNASQHWNHMQFWDMMGPNGAAMPGVLEAALTESFGSVAAFKEAFAVTKTENGVNPLCFGQTALLGCDVWEHSYYIDFRNKRPAYLSNFLEKLVNWENVAARLG